MAAAQSWNSLRNPTQFNTLVSSVDGNPVWGDLDTHNISTVGGYLDRLHLCHDTVRLVVSLASTGIFGDEIVLLACEDAE